MARFFTRICAVVLFAGAAVAACGGTVVVDDSDAGAGGVGGGGPRPCGNGVLNTGEVCDGSLLGGKTCNSATGGSKPSGTLKCSLSCTFDTTGCVGSGGFGGSTGSGGTAGMGGSFGGTAGMGGGFGGSAGQPVDFGSCVSGDACVLVANSCCGYCGPEPLGMFTAVNQRYVSDFQRMNCSGPIACPTCITYTEPHYTAACRSGRCVAVDVRVDPLSACSTSPECRLRWGAQCCEQCAGDPSGQLLTAVRASGFEASVCGSSFGCPDCAIAEYPANARALCSGGNCTVDVSMR